MSDRLLVSRRCVACEGGIPVLAQDAVLDLLQRLKGWKLVAEATAIECTYRFDSYAAVVAFANTVAWLATKENHHPVMELHYDHCVVRYTTHAVGGLSENDFICAAKVDALLEL